MDSNKEVSSGANANVVIDLHKASRKKGLVEVSTNGITYQNQIVDTSWLPFAAKQYNLSGDIKDYVMVPVVISPCGFPNRNGVAFLLEDLVSFNTELGMQYYLTWRGKPTFYEHDSSDIKKANGLILDVSLSSKNYWKIINFLAFDRTKDVDLIQRVISGDVKTYSMGAYITGGYTCSICGKVVGTCNHLDIKSRKLRLFGDQLAFRLGRYPVGFETSIVEVPAWSVAESTKVIY
jgi:hypothetical protein